MLQNVTVSLTDKLTQNGRLNVVLFEIILLCVPGHAAPSAGMCSMSISVTEYLS